MKISSVFKLLVLLALAGVVGWVLLGRPATATVVAVKRGPVVNAVTATVSVRADHTMELRGENGGRIRSSTLAVGARVHAGEVAVQLDDSDLQAELRRLTDERDAARKRLAAGSANEPALATAREELAKAERQADAGTFPKADLEKLRRSAQQLETALALEKIDREAALADLESRLKAQQQLIAKTRVTLPEDGQVVTVLARPGDLVAPGATLAMLLSEARAVEGSISEESFASVTVGQRATVTFLGYGAEKFEATVAAVLPTADPATQRYTVRFDVKIASDRLVPGLSGEASVILGEHANALLVPRRALSGDTVLVVKDGRVERRQVKRGFATMLEAELLGGAEAGELVITDNLEAFHAGDRVRVAQP
ncbi:MAG: efflux RND transporter periplasmic adaptor subunit [Verrucomicrobiota bacterium]